MNIKEGILRSAWLDYAARVVPPGASAVQYEETRRGFYSGAIVVMGALEAVSRPGTSEAAGVAIMTGVNRECRAFAAEMRAAGARSGRDGTIPGE